MAEDDYFIDAGVVVEWKTYLDFEASLGIVVPIRSTIRLEA
jgi:hypothetical protein